MRKDERLAPQVPPHEADEEGNAREVREMRETPPLSYGYAKQYLRFLPRERDFKSL